MKKVTINEAIALDREHLRLTFLYVLGFVGFGLIMLGAWLDWFSIMFISPVVGMLAAIIMAKTSIETQIDIFLGQCKGNLGK